MPAARPGWRSRGEGAEGDSGGAVPCPPRALAWPLGLCGPQCGGARTPPVGFCPAAAQAASSKRAAVS